MTVTGKDWKKGAIQVNLEAKQRINGTIRKGNALINDNSNINIIEKETADGKTSGNNLYSFGGGSHIQSIVLELIQQGVIDVKDKPRIKEMLILRFIGCLKRPEFKHKHAVGKIAYGILPLIKSREDFPFFYLIDNDNLILTFDIPKSEIIVSCISPTGDKSIIDSFPLTPEGAGKARMYFVPPEYAEHD